MNLILKENGENAYMDSDFTDEQFQKLKGEIVIADTKAMDKDSFWLTQLQMDLDLREEVGKGK